ncbi:SSI family serine proteinase inhibitor [Amycolatopsis sp. CA-230715]|uniref:SSI family serine proteinase inhibitor n=1 Tax=Amycolatopsis sp. CA-230715 TaxID=2745196 RepID=UPI001C0112D8|nr:SSI family serine proteinase inhibitor [Amycolatopsis sp. CA-230715]QWF77329.1 Subtilisin inhibitor-like protein 2 [Amycolatopsis sp. CA-230715]
MPFLLEPIVAGALTLASLGSPAATAPTSLQLNAHDTTGRVAAVSLACDPARGTHPKSNAACAVLDSIDGDFSRLPLHDQPCTLEYAPVDVTAIGVYRGQRVDFRTTYSNRCAADAGSSGVFAF